MAKGVSLKVNDKEIRLKDFPMRALKNTILGYIKSLNLEEEPKDIKIHISLDEEDKGGA